MQKNVGYLYVHEFPDAPKFMHEEQFLVFNWELQFPYYPYYPRIFVKTVLSEGPALIALYGVFCV